MPLTDSQREAVESIREPLFIQAGAGTGKTFTLTKRLAHGLSEDSGYAIGGVGRLLTITFTNKAAGELIGRVRAELRACGLAEEALQVDAAWISTIHSMCRRMLLTHAFDVGVDPGANLLTEDESKGLSAIALDRLLQENAADERLERLFDAFGVEQAVKLASALSSLLSLAPRGLEDFDFGPAPAAANQQVVQGALQVFERAAAELEELGIPEGKSSYEKNRGSIAKTLELLTGWLENAPQSITWADIEKLAKDCPNVRGGKFKEPYTEIFAACKGAVVDLQATAACANAYELLQIAAGFAAAHVELHRALKREKGALDTNDLLIAAYRMLAGDPAIAQEYRDQFDSIMVDEFQDTDSLQVGIIGQICDSELSTLTTVGDAQQSIYGFRGADLEVYRDMRATMRAHNSHEVELTANFRSHADILRFVEDIFSKPEFFGGEFLKVSSGRVEAAKCEWLGAEEPRVKVLLAAGHKSESGRSYTSVDALRREDARAIADEFERLKGQGASYGDMAILLQSTKATRAGAYLRELRSRGIPCIVSGGSDFFLLNEVGTLVMLLRVLANRDDDEALFALLGSEMFCATDDELLLLSVTNKQRLRVGPEQARLKPSLFDALNLCVHSDSCEVGPALTRAFDVLRIATKDVSHLPLSQVLCDAVERSGWAASLREQRIEGGAVYANLERFCDMLDDYESLNGRSVYRASEYFRNMLSLAVQGTGARSKLGTLVSSGNEAVQIMTIHSSKGLEFPIVAVAEFEKNARGGAGDLYSLTEDHGRYLALGTSSSEVGGSYIIEGAPDVESFAQAGGPVSFRAHAYRLNKQRQQEEQQRLLYVALTRARDMLFLVAHDKAFGSTGELCNGLTKDCLSAVFEQEVPTSNATVKTKAGALVELRIASVPYESAGTQGVQGEQSCTVTHIYPELPKEPRISSYLPSGGAIHSYSSIAKRDGGAHEPVAQEISLRNREEEAETVSPVGSAFHLVAQWVAERRDATPQVLESRIASVVKRYELTSQQTQRLLMAVDEWVGSDRFAQIMGMPHVYAEHPFCVDIDGYALEGFIDLACFDLEGSALVIDYKTGTSAQGDAETLRERYTLQAQCYAYALLSSGSCEHVELAFVRPEAHMEEIVFEFGTEDVPALAAAILASE